jgi:hypothetical protein
MIPDIGLVVAAYVVFRVVEIFTSMDRSGQRSGLPAGSKGAIVLFGLVAAAVAIIVVIDLFQQSAEASRQLAASQRALEASRRALESIPGF